MDKEISIFWKHFGSGDTTNPAVHVANDKLLQRRIASATNNGFLKTLLGMWFSSPGNGRGWRQGKNFKEHSSQNNYNTSKA